MTEMDLKLASATVIALRAYRQADEEGIMCAVSRESVEQAIDLLDAFQEENKTLSKLASQRGARMQIIWEWMSGSEPAPAFLTIRDQFMMRFDLENYDAWFDEDGVPVEK